MSSIQEIRNASITAAESLNNYGIIEQFIIIGLLIVMYLFGLKLLRVSLGAFLCLFCYMMSEPLIIQLKNSSYESIMPINYMIDVFENNRKIFMLILGGFSLFISFIFVSFIEFTKLIIGLILVGGAGYLLYEETILMRFGIDEIHEKALFLVGIAVLIFILLFILPKVVFSVLFAGTGTFGLLMISEANFGFPEGLINLVRGVPGEIISPMMATIIIIGISISIALQSINYFGK